MRTTPLLFLMMISTALFAADQRKGSEPIEVSTLAELKARSTELGRPMAILYMDTVSTCPLHNGQCSRWLDTPELGDFVVLKVDWKSKGEEIKAVSRLRRESKDKAGTMIPMLFLVDDQAAYQDVLPYNIDDGVVKKALQHEVEEFGVVLPVIEVQAINKELAKVALLLADGKTDNARTILKKVKPIAAKANKAGFAKTYADAESAFNQHIIAECDVLLKSLVGKPAEERLKKVTPLLRKHKDLLSEATAQTITAAANKLD